jgi:hypothetical protein
MHLSPFFMFRLAGKILFANLDRDQQRQRISQLVVTLLAIGFSGGVVVVAILMINKR